MTQIVSDPQVGIGREYDEADGDEYTYKSLSRAAVLSLVFSLMALLAWASPILLFLPVCGIVFGVVALRNLKKFPEELIGFPVAVVGLVLSFLVLISGSAKHIYVYNTEVPEGYERIQFATLMTPIGAPDFPPREAIKLDGKKVFLKGYIHPTSVSSNRAKSFVLVPDWATCCFGTQPRLTHMIEVTLTSDMYANKSFRLHSLAGTLEVNTFITPVEGLEGVYYQLEADHFE